MNDDDGADASQELTCPKVNDVRNALEVSREYILFIKKDGELQGSVWMCVYIYRIWSTIMEINYLDNSEKRRCIWHHKQFKTRFREHMVTLKIISLYI